MPLKIIRERLASMEGAWALGAVLVALLMSVPIFAILAAFFTADQGAWKHLQETLLLEYVFNSTLLMIVTGIIAGGLGVGCAWLVAEEGGLILGYGYFAPFRPRSAYRFTAEASV